MGVPPCTPFPTSARCRPRPAQAGGAGRDNWAPEARTPIEPPKPTPGMGVDPDTLKRSPTPDPRRDLNSLSAHGRTRDERPSSAA